MPFSLSELVPWSYLGFASSAGNVEEDAASSSATLRAPGVDELADQGAGGPPALSGHRVAMASQGRQQSSRAEHAQGDDHLAPLRPASVPGRPGLARFARGMPARGRLWRVSHDGRGKRAHRHQISRRTLPTAWEFDEDIPDDAADAESLEVPHHPSSFVTGRVRLRAHSAAAMMQSCLSFAAWLKDRDVTGEKLEEAFKGNCALALKKGGAATMSEARYEDMCRSVGCAVATLGANGTDWEEKPVCEAVVGTFVHSGIGASPLVD